MSENRRHVIDCNGAPFMIHGDTAWSLITGITKDEIELYLTDRARKGFNSIIVNLIEHKFNGPATREGLLPFADPNDFTTTNDAYFDHAEWVVAKARGCGIQVFLAPMYLGYPRNPDDEGWYHEALTNGVDKCREYGRYVCRRFDKYDNIVWMMGGDRNPGASLDHVNAVAAGIRECADTDHLFTAHTLPEHSPAIEYAKDSWLTLNSTYTYAIVHRKLYEDYKFEPTMPFCLIESTYEGEHNASDVQIRRQAYWAMLSGACGDFFGNYPIWEFSQGWQSALNSRGSHDMMRLKMLFSSRAWYTLVPDLEHVVVVAGLGEFRGLDFCTAARANDGSLMIAYVPTPRTITVDLDQLRDPMQAWWFNPRTADVLPAGQSHRFRTRFKEFSPPDRGDWVLVIDDASTQLPLPGHPPG
ncbi:MAG: DUF4038 domain-containing protein [Candidatus Bathyarchaeia archaeon]